MRRTLTFTAALLLAALPFALGAFVLAEAPAAPATPTAESSPAAPAAAESPALVFARRDVERGPKAVEGATAQVAKFAAQLTAAEQALATVQTAKSAAEKAGADAVVAMKAAEQAKGEADKLAQATATTAKQVVDDPASAQEAKDKARVDAEQASQLAAEADQALKRLIEAKAAADAGLAAATKQVTEHQAAVKALGEEKVAAEKTLAAVTQAVQEGTARLAFFEKSPPKADPDAVRLVRTFQHKRVLMSCRIAPSGDFVFAGGQDNSIQRWDLVSGSQLAMTGHKSWVGDLAFLPGGQTLLSGGYEGQAIVWNTPVEAPAAARTLAAHKGHVRAVAVSRDGKLCATAGNDKLVRVWTTVDGTLVREFAGHQSHVYNVTFHPDGKALASGDLKGVLKHWDLETGQHVRDLDASALYKYDPSFQADCGGVRGLDFSPDGKHIAAGGIGEVTNAFAGVGKPTVVLFDWTTGQKVHVMLPKGAGNGSVWGLQFHPSGEFLVGAGGTALWFWKLDQPAAILDFGIPAVAYDLSFHPDGMRFAICCFDSTVRIYDLSPKPPAADSATAAATK